MRDALVEAAANCDVLINFNGANIHPAWLPELPTFNVYICFDDPESSEFLSRPVAPYFDFSFTANAACVPQYQGWGIQRVDFLPHGAWDTEFDPEIDRRQILDGHRDLDGVFFGERESVWRRERLDRLVREFPNGVFHGRGWPGGFVSDGQKLDYYRRAKIGWNIHNSVGPVNLRTYALPANGVLEIGDNKCRLGSIFKLHREVIGFDTMDECIELTRYFLDHDDERREIAAAGFERVHSEYREEVIWERLVETIAPYVDAKRTGSLPRSTWTADSGSVIYSALRRIRRASREARRELSGGQRKPGQDSEHGHEGAPYLEREEVGAVNWREKLKRVEDGGFLEWPNMVALNWAVTRFVGEAQSIVEVGGGTGAFAYEAAADPRRTVLCADADEDSIAWARANRSRPNIEYRAGFVVEEDGPFDLAVSVEVVEHLEDFTGFLRLLTHLAPRAIITTPNRARDEPSQESLTPAYYQHVREWTAGEFYWVLRCFYSDVQLFSMPDPFVPWTVPATVNTRATPLIGVCANPL